MSETNLRDVLEQMSQLADTYISTDFEHISYTQIDSDLELLRTISVQYSGNDDLTIILGLVSQLIPHFYTTRSFLASNRRDYDYFYQMQKINEICLQLKTTIRLL